MRTGGLLVVVVAITLAALAGAGSAAAADGGKRPAALPPLTLPGDAAAAGVRTSAGRWVVGAAPGGRAAAVARRFGATAVLGDRGVYSIPRGRARGLAAALRARGLLRFAEPDRPLARKAFPVDPLKPLQWWLPAVVDQSLTPPAVTDSSPRLAVVEDDQVDLTHPEFAGGRVRSTSAAAANADHMTEVVAIAGAPANGRGILGVWPGMNVLASPTSASCTEAARTVLRSAEAGAAVINMSYVIAGGCFTHQVATSAAFSLGTVVVAAAGNEFQQGNPADNSPASDPHVVTVAALNPNLTSASFSNANGAVDVSAPGVDVLTAVPPAFDPDGTPDGYTFVDGTSFSAPMVSAAAAWIDAARPGMTASQLSDLLRFSARDLGSQGWDADFGWGILDLGAGLRARRPANDPKEPNDDIAWVDGSVFFRSPHRVIWRGRGVARLAARVDLFEDPVDVYRVVVPGRSTVRVRLRPRFGDPDLEAYSRRASTVFRNRGRLARSTRGAGRLDSVTLTNRSRARRLMYLDIYANPQPSADSEYRLEVRRVRFSRRARPIP